MFREVLACISEPMQLFHASTNLYRAGDVLHGRDHAYAGPRAKFESRVAEKRSHLDRDRRNSLFATTTEYFAEIYQKAQWGDGLFNSSPGAELHLYRIDCEVVSGHPMALLDIAFQAMQQGRDVKFDAIVSEYWSPTNEWSYLEFLSGQFTVTEELDRKMLDLVKLSCAWSDFSADKKAALDMFGSNV